jgi:hypothetical protein
MPKSEKAAESYFNRRHKALQENIDKHLAAVQENIRTARAKKSELIRKKSLLIKHTQIRRLFVKLAKPADIERVVTAINGATGPEVQNPGNENRGQQWEEAYEANLNELCRLTDDGLTNIKKLIQKKEEEEKKLLEIQRKVEEFHNSCLVKLQELKTEGQKPFQISSSEGPGNDYLYSQTPFQCYE